MNGHPPDILKKIVKHQREELADVKPKIPLAKLRARSPVPLRGEGSCTTFKVRMPHEESLSERISHQGARGNR
jgi:hypothetical protein